MCDANGCGVDIHDLAHSESGSFQSSQVQRFSAISSRCSGKMVLFLPTQQTVKYMVITRYGDDRCHTVQVSMIDAARTAHDSLRRRNVPKSKGLRIDDRMLALSAEATFWP